MARVFVREPTLSLLTEAADGASFSRLFRLERHADPRIYLVARSVASAESLSASGGLALFFTSGYW